MKDFCLILMIMENKSFFGIKMTEKIAFEVDVKICFSKKCKKLA